MLLLEMILRYGRYHLWGHDRALKMIEASGAPEDAVNPFRHTLAADQIWLQRIRFGGQPTADEPADLAAAKDLLFELKRQWSELFESLTDEALLKVMAYRNMKGDPYEHSLGEILMHVFNHGTHHRGQIARAVRLAGGEPIPTDLIVFFRQE